MATSQSAVTASEVCSIRNAPLVPGNVPLHKSTRRRKRKKKGSRLPPFVAMPWSLLNSRAYIELNNSARVALIYFNGKPHKIYDSSEYYDTVFSFPYREGQLLGFPTGTFSKVIKELVKHGFLDPVRKGGCYGDMKATNNFRLSKRWMQYGNKDFITSDWTCFIHKPRVKRAAHADI